MKFNKAAMTTVAAVVASTIAMPTIRAEAWWDTGMSDGGYEAGGSWGYFDVGIGDTGDAYWGADGTLSYDGLGDVDLSVPSGQTAAEAEAVNAAGDEAFGQEPRDLASEEPMVIGLPPTEDIQTIRINGRRVNTVQVEYVMIGSAGWSVPAGNPSAAPRRIGIGTKEEKRVPAACWTNSTSNPMTVNTSVTVKVSYTVQSTLSASALQLLSAEIGVTLNTERSETVSVNLTVNPGESIAVMQQYRIEAWVIPTASGNEFANVLVPIGQTYKSEPC